VVGDDDASDGAWAAIALMGIAATRRRRSAR
jgi:MYXO-CTERM domain-containing protein